MPSNSKTKPSVFEHAHAREIKKVKDDGTWGAAQLETIVHPNEYFKRSYLLRSLGKPGQQGQGQQQMTLNGDEMGEVVKSEVEREEIKMEVEVEED